MVGTDYETQNVEAEEREERNLEAAILRDLSKRTPNCNWTEEDWDEDAELIKEWQWTDSFQLAICSNI